MNHPRYSLYLIAGAAALFALWETAAHRFLMGLPVVAQHGVSGAVGTVLALLIAVVATRTILRQQQEMQRLARLKDDLTQMVVHDLRTPLTALIGSLETVKAGVAGEIPPDAQEMTEIALGGSHSLLRMVNDLLDIARMEAGESVLEMDATSAALVVREAVSAVSPLANSRSIQLSCDIATGIPTLLLDGEKVRRVLVNLLGNALKFTPSGGRVGLQATWSETARRLTLVVSDTGEGIPPEYRERIFDKFGQVASRRAGRKMSTGLGLTFCKMAVDAHGGTIRVESEPGKGSVFTVEIPAQVATGEGPTHQTGSLSPASPLKPPLPPAPTSSCASVPLSMAGRHTCRTQHGALAAAGPCVHGGAAGTVDTPSRGQDRVCCGQQHSL